MATKNLNEATTEELRAALAQSVAEAKARKAAERAERIRIEREADIARTEDAMSAYEVASSNHGSWVGFNTDYRGGLILTVSEWFSEGAEVSMSKSDTRALRDLLNTLPLD